MRYPLLLFLFVFSAAVVSGQAPADTLGLRVSELIDGSLKVLRGVLR